MHGAECVTVCSARGRPYLIDFSQPPDLTNPPVDENGSWEAILAPKLNRPAWHCRSVAGRSAVRRDPGGLADFSNLGKVINVPQLVLIHPAADLDEHEREPIRSLQHRFSSSSMN